MTSKYFADILKDFNCWYLGIYLLWSTGFLHTYLVLCWRRLDYKKCRELIFGEKRADIIFLLRSRVPKKIKTNLLFIFSLLNCHFHAYVHKILFRILWIVNVQMIFIIGQNYTLPVKLYLMLHLAS